MKQQLKSLQVRMLLPVIAMTTLVVTLLTVLFSRAYTAMILQQEQGVNEAGFEAVSNSLPPLINRSVKTVQSTLSDDRVAAYARLQFSSVQDLIHARLDCRDYMRSEVGRNEGIYGILCMREDGSLFGVMPEANIFLDNPEDDPLPKEMTEQILKMPIGQMSWFGPISGSVLQGFENDNTPEKVMIAVWKSADIRYGECYAMLLMDESIFGKQFTALEDGYSTWHIFTPDNAEIYHTGELPCSDPEKLILESNTGTVFHNESGQRVWAFSTVMEFPNWTLVREASVENYEQVIQRVRTTVALIALVVFLIALSLYRLWLRKFMRQFNTLREASARMGEGELEPVEAAPYTITEFET
ncbi:MAG: hypothetical protein UIB39_09525, partial [Lachnospiraceae bacterium]|nr:hypothetical protein [Lachnospiraceae bacterium]